MIPLWFIYQGQFGCLHWSKAEDKLLYVSERKTPKTVSFFDTKKTDKPEEEQPTRVICIFTLCTYR